MHTEYHIAYYFTDRNGNSGYGSQVVDARSGIKTALDLSGVRQEMAKGIPNCNPNQIVILCIHPLEKSIAKKEHTEQAEKHAAPSRRNVAPFVALIEQALKWFDDYIVDMEGEQDDEDALTDAWNHWQKTIGEGEVWNRMIEEAEKWKREAKCAIKEARWET